MKRAKVDRQIRSTPATLHSPIPPLFARRFPHLIFSLKKRQGPADKIDGYNSSVGVNQTNSH
jgi:hypothetical protein